MSLMTMSILLECGSGLFVEYRVKHIFGLTQLCLYDTVMVHTCKQTRRDTVKKI